MIFEHFNYTDYRIKDKLKLADAPRFSWEYYYASYSYTLNKIITDGLGKNYAFNPCARAIMFLLRHNLELCLKHNISKAGITVPVTHEFTGLTAAYIPPPAFVQIVRMIDRDPDGSCYRYYISECSGLPFFGHGDMIELGKVFKLHNSLMADRPDTFELRAVSPVFDYNDRMDAWDLTLHLGECTGLGQIRTQYDFTIAFLIGGILERGYNAELVYLPLMFMLRHSMELALKSNINQARTLSLLVSSEDITHLHSLSRLLRIYNDFLNPLASALSEQLATQLAGYRERYSKLNETIHQLDSQSRHFRFPVDKMGTPIRFNTSGMQLANVLELYELTDPFLNFTNAVLKDCGLIG